MCGRAILGAEFTIVDLSPIDGKLGDRGIIKSKQCGKVTAFERLKIVLALPVRRTLRELSTKEQRVDETIAAGAKRLLGRAQDPRALDVESITPRVRATVEKYLL